MNDTPQLITPQVINEVEFRQKVRGYDPDEVDDFLERMAMAVADLQDRLREVTERAAAAERRPGGVPRRAVADPPGADETDVIRRTLVLAQRTADAAIQEARQTAADTVAEAQGEADRLIGEARVRAATLVSTAEQDARQIADDARERLVGEVAALEQTADALERDIDLLERHVDEQRTRVRSSAAALEELLDDPAKLKATAVPLLSGACMPTFAEPGRPASTTDRPAPAPAAAPARAPAPAPDDDIEHEHDRGELGDGDDDDDGDDDTTVVTSFRPGAPAAFRQAEPRSRFAPLDAGPGPPTEPFRIDDPNATDDAYLDELRKAMIDPDQAGDGDASGRGLFDQDGLDDPTRGRNRFGRRR